MRMCTAVRKINNRKTNLGKLQKQNLWLRLMRDTEYIHFRSGVECRDLK